MIQLPPVPLRHQPHRLRPAPDDLLGRERDGLPAPDGRGIELGPVEERARVVARARRVRRDAAPRALDPAGPARWYCSPEGSATTPSRFALRLEPDVPLGGGLGSVRSVGGQRAGR
jgi:hypothetical protein